MNAFQYPAIHELTAQQVRFAPASKRREQLKNAEKLMTEIEPTKHYPYQFVCFRLTDFRSNAYPDLLIRGDELQHDLALFIIRVERSLPPLPREQVGEEMLTLEEICQRFNVSPKTIGRWRLRGLVARRFKANGRSQLGFPLASVESFARSHGERVAKSSRFSQLSEPEREQIILTARKMAADGATFVDVSRRIANELHRSPEAIRYTIKNFDKTHPDAAVFPEITGPLDAADKEQIFSALQEGNTVESIAKKFNRTRSSVYRVVNEVKASRLVAQPVDYIYNSDFDNPAKEREILGPMPGEDEFFDKVRSMRPPKDVDAHMAYLYERPLLTREQEAHLFRKMNYLKHKLFKLRSKLEPSRARVQDIQQVDTLQTQIKELRDLLIECNQRLVHSLATKHMQVGQNLDELKSDANISIMRAVEKFDYSRGNKFSTYATWAVMKNFARSIPDENTRRQRYVTGADDAFDSRQDVRTDEHELIAVADAARERVYDLLDHLDSRTRDVIKMRTGLAGHGQMTLEQIGQHFGITKERVRQINVRGMKILRERAAEQKVELP